MVNTEIRLIMFFVAEDGEALYTQQKQDWELIVAQIMYSLLPIQTWIEESRERETLDYSVFFKSLRIIQWTWQIDSSIRSDRQSARRTMDRGLWHCTGGNDQDHPQEKEIQIGKKSSEEALQIAEKRRETKRKGEKERYIYLNAEFQRIAKRDKKVFLSDECEDIEENNWMGKTSDLFKKLEIPREYFMQRWAQ